MSDLAAYVEARCIPEPNSGCWLWLLSTGSHGYGQGVDQDMRNARNPSGVTTAHRISYKAFKGPIPDGYEVDHLCRNRLCVNPDHLEAVTPLENERRLADAQGKQRWSWETAEERRLQRNAYKARWAREKRAKAAA